MHPCVLDVSSSSLEGLNVAGRSRVKQPIVECGSLIASLCSDSNTHSEHVRKSDLLNG